MHAALTRAFRSVKQVNVVFAATSSGQKRRGAEKSPEILRKAGVFDVPGWTTNWAGEVTEEHLHYPPSDTPVHNIRNLPRLGEFLHLLYSQCCEAYDLPGFLLNIGGGHSITSSTISAGVTKYPDIGVVWVDAHADCKTPDSSPSKYYHAMPLAHVLGIFQEPLALGWLQHLLEHESIVMVGIREVDKDEQQLINFEKIKYYTADDVRTQGIKRVMQESLAYLESQGKKQFHLGLDVDGMDPQYFPGTGVTVPKGLSMTDIAEVFNALKAKGDDFVSMDIVELNFMIEKTKTLEDTRELIRMLLS